MLKVVYRIMERGAGELGRMWRCRTRVGAVAEGDNEVRKHIRTGKDFITNNEDG